MGPGNPALVADCVRCAALCCVALPFALSSDFALRKAAGVPCPNLAGDYRCRVHDRLRVGGFAGCANFDCFGAGQRITQVTFPGVDWRASPAHAQRVFHGFAVMVHVHAMLWHLDAARAMAVDADLAATLERASIDLEVLASATPEDQARVDTAHSRGEVNGLLLQVSERVRSGEGIPGRSRRGANLLGARLRGDDLRRVDLFGACLVGTDLRGADLRGADLRGADLRGTDLRGADLRGALFLTRSQVASARGDGSTRLPTPLERPGHWAGGASGQARADRSGALAGDPS